jgi:transposase
MHQADADENGSGDRLSSSEKKEHSELRRHNRRLEPENDILKRVATYFARKNVLPKSSSRWSASSPTTESRSRWPARS